MRRPALARSFRRPWWRLAQARAIARPAPTDTLPPRWQRSERRALIWLLAIVDVVILGLLALVVTRPGEVAALPRWVERSVQPDAWWTVLVLALTAIAAAALYRTAHRRRDASLAFITGASLTFVTFVLALPSYAGCSGDEARVWTPLTQTMSLFLGSVDDPFGTVCPGAMPLALQVARLTAILTTFLSLVAVALTMLSAQRDRVRARLARSVVLVVGLDTLTLPFIETLVEREGAGRTVVLLEPDRTNPLVPVVRGCGVRVVFGDVADPQVVEKLFIRDGVLGRRSILASAYIVTPEASEAITVADAVLRAAAAPRPDGTYPRLVTRIDDPRQAEAWRRRQVTDELVVLTDTVGLYRITAEEVVDRALGEQVERLVILGSSPMAVAVLEELVQHRREQSVKRSPPTLETIVIADDAAEFLDDHVRTQAWYLDRVRQADVPRVINATPSLSSVAEALGTGPKTHVVVALEPSSTQEQLTGRLALRYPSTQFLAWRDGIQGLAPNRVLANVTSFGLTLVATHVGKQGAARTLPEDGWERIARRLHENYVEERSRDGRTPRPSERDWDELPRFYRESNLRRVAVALQVATRAGRTWLPPTDGPRVPRRMTEDEVADLAHIEHTSWCCYYRANGWRRGPRRERPNRPLLHPGLVSWDQLSEEDRAYTIQSLMQCLDYLEAMGYVPFDAAPPDDGGRYRRTGTVTARRRAASWTWTTRTGATMRARPGDWEVTDGDGGSWSVTDEDFHRTYTRVEGDTYARTGEVHARRTVRGEQVVSTEGAEIAREGDWVLQDELGRRWIVPDERFTRVYRRVDA